MPSPTAGPHKIRDHAGLPPALMLAAAVLFLFPAGARGQTTALKTAADECEESGSGWVFCCGFEEGDFSLWDDYDGNPPETNQILSDPGPLELAENHVLRLRVPPGTGGADLVKVLPATYDELYLRFYIKWEDGYDFSVLSHGSGLHAGERGLLTQSGFRPDGTDRFNAYFEPGPREHRPNFYSYYRGMYQDCVDPDGSCWGDRFPCMLDEGENYCTKPQHRDTVPTPVLETGRWYCVEMYLNGGAPTLSEDGANGVLDLWIDGEEYGPWDDLWLRTTPDLKIAILWLNLYYNGEHGTEGILIDNVVVGTERIGGLGDITPAENTRWGSLKSMYR